MLAMSVLLRTAFVVATSTLVSNLTGVDPALDAVRSLPLDVRCGPAAQQTGGLHVWVDNGTNRWSPRFVCANTTECGGPAATQRTRLFGLLSGGSVDRARRRTDGERGSAANVWAVAAVIVAALLCVCLCSRARTTAEVEGEVRRPVMLHRYIVSSQQATGAIYPPTPRRAAEV